MEFRKWYDKYSTDCRLKYPSIKTPKTFVLNGQFPEKELRYSSRSVNEMIKQVASKAGISKRVYAHLMRHNSFTHMMESGADINMIQRIAGHNNVKTTNLYLHLSDSTISKIRSPLADIKL